MDQSPYCTGHYNPPYLFPAYVAMTPAPHGAPPPQGIEVPQGAPPSASMSRATTASAIDMPQDHPKNQDQLCKECGCHDVYKIATDPAEYDRFIAKLVGPGATKVAEDMSKKIETVEEHFKETVKDVHQAVRELKKREAATLQELEDIRAHLASAEGTEEEARGGLGTGPECVLAMVLRNAKDDIDKVTIEQRPSKLTKSYLRAKLVHQTLLNAATSRPSALARLLHVPDWDSVKILVHGEAFGILYVMRITGYQRNEGYWVIIQEYKRRGIISEDFPIYTIRGSEDHTTDTLRSLVAIIFGLLPKEASSSRFTESHDPQVNCWTPLAQGGNHAALAGSGAGDRQGLVAPVTPAQADATMKTVNPAMIPLPGNDGRQI